MVRKFYGNNDGFTLVEILAVVVILGVLAAVAVPSIIGHIRKTEVNVCDANASELLKRYNQELVLEDKDHSDLIFTSFLVEHDEYVCPVGGTYHYVEGDVECSEHGDVDLEEDDGYVPFL